MPAHRPSPRTASSSPAGYSTTPLVKKLGIKPGDVVALYGAPDHYLALLGELPEGATTRDGGSGAVPFAHFFTASRAALQKALPKLAKVVFPDGMLWVSWPKKGGRMHLTKQRSTVRDAGELPIVASQVMRPTDGVSGDDVLDETGVRELVLPTVLVDVKVCAIDADWSGHKFVWRKELRGK